MKSSALGAVARRFNELWTVGTVAGLTEDQLLERFRARRDEAAFAALVARHGPMVRGVCRAMLRDIHAADDAFQAVFLVLARRAGSIREPERLGAWLYGVAHRVASKARVQAGRRLAREVPSSTLECEDEMARPTPFDPLATDSLPVIHEELAKLPKRYRDTAVLCWLEGCTQDEAARRMRCPIGTVKGRLSRARHLMRERLERRGVTIGAAGLVGMLSASSRGEIPELVLLQLSKAAALFVTGSSVAGVSALATQWAERVAHAMAFTTIKWAAGGLLAFGLVAAGAVVQGQGSRSSGSSDGATANAEGEPEASTAPSFADITNELQHKSDDVQPESLAQRRLQAAQAFFEAAKAFYEQGTITIDRYLAASDRLMQAETDITPDASSRLKAMQRHLDSLEQLVKREQAKFDVGHGSLPNVAEAELNLAEARYRLATSAREPAASDNEVRPAVGSLQPDEAPAQAEDDVPVAERNDRVIRRLAKPVSLSFGGETPLSDLIEYVKAATVSPELPGGIPIYVDPAGLTSREITTQSPITINLENISLKRGLFLALRQLDLVYTVQDGLLIISTPELLDEMRETPPIYGVPESAND